MSDIESSTMHLPTSSSFANSSRRVSYIKIGSVQLCCWRWRQVDYKLNSGESPVHQSLTITAGCWLCIYCLHRVDCPTRRSWFRHSIFVDVLLFDWIPVETAVRAALILVYVWCKLGLLMVTVNFTEIIRISIETNQALQIVRGGNWWWHSSSKKTDDLFLIVTACGEWWPF